MKYVLFTVFALGFVPVAGMLAFASRRYFSWLFASAVFFTLYINSSRIHFWSYETYRGPDRGFEVSLIDLIMLALLPRLCFNRQTRWLPYNGLPLLGLTLWAWVSFSQTPEGARLFSLFTCVKMLKVVVLYWLSSNALRLGLELRHLLIAISSIAILLTLTALKQKYLFGFYRITGPFDHSNTIPMYVGMLVPALYLGIACASRGSWSKALFGLLATFGMVFSVLATQSRAGIILVGTSLVLSVTLSLWRSLSWPGRARHRVQALALFVAILGGLGGLKALHTIIVRFQTAPPASEEAREEFNYAAQLMLADRPWTGVGVNCFSYVLTREARYNGHIVVMANEEEAGVAHHIYRLTAAEMGYPGLFFFCLFWLRAWWRPLRTGFTRRNDSALLLLAFPLGFQTLYLVGFLEWAYRLSPVIYLYTMLAGISSGACEQDQFGPIELQGEGGGRVNALR